jgi:hypothetical protein
MCLKTRIKDGGSISMKNAVWRLTVESGAEMVLRIAQRKIYLVMMTENVGISQMEHAGK